MVRPDLNIETKINHNDLTTSNTIINELGEPVIIDNEFLACNDGWFMNRYNSNFFKEKYFCNEVDRNLFKEICKTRRKYIKT